ncbi:MAG: SDR family oxidoreductase [Candidatus Thiodiazotropha lotti]|uniref:SDR family oxidoreductase n=1 Tax=Candidatus Thiodiazotropha endoloripes TaxID=1818881 RepID=UPI00083D4982|nr:SDR family oxidoreductase [Candidatus Thiodiazotropha endoloripes]MCG7914596.1 SDR family oxidoreductase [Candidatus Thiodiazotropha weberae]MCG7990958.1 SDR family oxidoreductase [Candidatus Thiodiazotropha lotti]MCG8001182.1 SDR family oxidoreductase [Candidatus Thiodiazotropha lotti]MCW4182612.1 SDR family oxidoreductase [Candidatus Thiodiazotropha weberae]MCW4192956.1 SDR family oxidoreductase [Candidatus Thiodiazotropha weberae]
MGNQASRKLLISGATHGIGKAISRFLLEQGNEVVGIGRDFSAWTDPPDRLHKVTFDLSDLERLPGCLNEVIRSHPDLDGVVLNAGYGQFGSLEEFSFQQIRQMIDVNLTQHIYIARAMVPQLKKLGRGDIIIIGSESALSGGKRGSLYSACKFALRGFAQSLRAECSTSGARVCLINPGMVDSDFFNELDFRPGDAPENYLRVEDIAEVVHWVLSAHPGTVFDEINLNPLKRVIQSNPS